MFRLPILFIFMLLVVATQAQPGTGLNQTDPKGRKQGAWAKNWPSGKLRYEGTFKDDLPVDTFKHYSEEGHLTTFQIYAPNGIDSRAKHFHPDGSLMAVGKYSGKEKDSIWTYYDSEGRTRKVEQFQAGTLHGEQVTYFDNGQPSERSNFENGTITGVRKTWFPSGMLASEENYVNGLAEGKSTVYFPSGKKELEGNMVRGERDGTWMHFNDDGSLHVKLIYQKGVLVKETRENGIFKEYFPDEKPKAEFSYKNGKLDGPFVEFNNDGEWITKQVPADPVSGAKPDVERVLHGQTKKREGKYKGGELDGEVREYDETGKLVKVKKYEAGVELGSK